MYTRETYIYCTSCQECTNRSSVEPRELNLYNRVPTNESTLLLEISHTKLYYEEKDCHQHVELECK